MNNIKIKIRDYCFNSPIIGASGCAGWGKEIETYNNLELIGGFVSKSITLNEKIGNAPPRVYEVNNGLLNSIGLENCGINEFIKTHLPYIKNMQCIKILNLAPFDRDDIRNMIDILENEEGIDGYEINISCPNIHKNGENINSSIKDSKDIIMDLRKYTNRLLILKLSPAFNESFEIAKIAQNEEFDAISFTNTYLGTAIDIEKREFVFKNKVAGFSGPAIKPMSLWNVYKMKQITKLPIIGIGGIRTLSDVLEYLFIGASLVQIGTALLVEPNILQRLSEELKEYLINNSIEDINSIIGIV